MEPNIARQYNNFHDTYSDNIHEDAISNEVFYNQFDFDLNGKKTLDVGCGDGMDLGLLVQKGALAYGVDPSVEFIAKAKKSIPQGIFIEGVGESIPFADKTFDVVISKWALQTSPNVPRILNEMARVLKPGGVLIFLSKHPWLQWLQKIRDFGHGIDYYKQQVVTSNIYSGKIVLKEPSHTIGEYFNKDFYSNFEVLNYQEGTDFPASEQLNEDTYPTFFVVKAKRKSPKKSVSEE